MDRGSSIPEKGVLRENRMKIQIEKILVLGGRGPHLS